MVTVLGIDPDTRTLALAVATETEVHRVGMVRVPDEKEKTVDSAALRMILLLPAALESFLQEIDLVVVEGQQIYQGNAAKPESILTLALVTGAVAAYVNLLAPSTTILLPKPAQWKGQTPKQINQARTYAHFGISFEQNKDYSWPSGCATAARIPGYHQTKRGDWKHIGDAIGLALWGARNYQEAQ